MLGPNTQSLIKSRKYSKKIPHKFFNNRNQINKQIGEIIRCHVLCPLLKITIISHYTIILPFLITNMSPFFMIILIPIFIERIL